MIARLALARAAGSTVSTNKCVGIVGLDAVGSVSYRFITPDSSEQSTIAGENPTKGRVL